jgi:hypothetical protein
VAAAVTEASDVPDESPVRPELVAVRAARGWADDPRARGGLYEVADSWATDVVIITVAGHNCERMTVCGEKLHGCSASLWGPCVFFL